MWVNRSYAEGIKQNSVTAILHGVLQYKQQNVFFSFKALQ